MAAASQQQQQVDQAIRLADGWWELLELAGQQRQHLTPLQWLRLLFRLFVGLYEEGVRCAGPDLSHADLNAQLQDLLAAAAASLRQAGNSCSSDGDGSGGGGGGGAGEPSGQQGAADAADALAASLSGPLADLLYAMALCAQADADDWQQQQQQLLAAAGGHHTSQANGSGDERSSDSGDGGGSSSSAAATAAPWFCSASSLDLLEAAAAVGTRWSMHWLGRKDAVSLLWAFGSLQQLQQQRNHQQQQQQQQRQQPSPAAGAFVSGLCTHLAALIRLANNTAGDAPHGAAAAAVDKAAAAAAAAAGAAANSGSRSAAVTPPGSLSEAWHPDDLADAACGLAAAGQRGPAAAALLDAVGHEAYRQLSNRHSQAGSAFSAEGLAALLGAYAATGYRDGPTLRALDAAATWVARRVRSRHVQAPASPAQLAALAGAFGALQHRSVVVPELLHALDTQAVRAAAAAVELAAADPDRYNHDAAGSRYCHWGLAHAASLLQCHLRLGFRPPQQLLLGLMPALLLQLQHEAAAAAAAATAAAAAAAGATAADGPSSQQQQAATSTRAQWPAVQPQHQVAAVEVLEVLAAAQHNPGPRVLSALMEVAWSGQPSQHLSSGQLVELLTATAQLGWRLPAEQLAAVADDLILLAAADGGGCSSAAATAAAQQHRHHYRGREHSPRQQQHRRRLGVGDVTRVMAALSSLGALDIARFGWLLVGLATGPWQRLAREDLAVVAAARAGLGRDGADMAEEVLPAQLARRVEEAAAAAAAAAAAPQREPL